MTYSRKSEIGWLEYNLRPSWTLSGSPMMIKELNDDINANFLAMSNQIHEINGTLNHGFNGIIEAIAILGGLFETRMTAIIEQNTKTHKFLYTIAQQLDAIYQTLRTPTQTKALEFRDMGLERMSRGLNDKALESFLESEKFNDTDLITQIQLGKIYLYGGEGLTSLIDLQKAKQHLTNAARYAKAEIKYLTSRKKTQLLHNTKFLAGEIGIHLAQLYFLLGNDFYKNNQKEQASIAYSQMATAAEFSIQNMPNLEASYLAAKSAVMLGNNTKALDLLKGIFQQNLTYLYKVKKDGDFSDLISEIDNMLLSLTTKGTNNFCMLSYELMRLNQPELALKMIKKAFSADYTTYKRFNKPIFLPIKEKINATAFWSALKELKEETPTPLNLQSFQEQQLT